METQEPSVVLVFKSDLLYGRMNGTLTSTLRLLEVCVSDLEPHSLLNTSLLTTGFRSSRFSTGILIWGPPGCGKSSIARALSQKFNPMYFINTDEIVEIILKAWDRALYYKLQSGELSDVEKQDHYWHTRRLNFSDFILPKFNVMSKIFKCLQLPTKSFTQEEFEAFSCKSDRNVVVEAFSDFLIFLAKHRVESFMFETTGTRFSPEWASQTFGDVKSILQLVFVSSVDTLIERVSHRSGQLVNATPERIRESYHSSYFESFQKALRSGIFAEIIVTSNDSMPSKVMMQLSKSHTGVGYILEVNPPAALNDSEYSFVIGILNSIGLNDTTLQRNRGHTGRLTGEFCSLSYTWSLLHHLP